MLPIAHGPSRRGIAWYYQRRKSFRTTPECSLDDGKNPTNEFVGVCQPADADLSELFSKTNSWVIFRVEYKWLKDNIAAEKALLRSIFGEEN